MYPLPNKKNIHSAHDAPRGFTLIEMIVAIGVFAVCVVLIVGSLISLNNASRKERNIRIAMDNVGAALDSMARNVRMGTRFHCGCGDIASGGTAPYSAGDTNFPGGERSCSTALGGVGESCLAFEGQGGGIADTDQIVFKLFDGQILRSTNSGGSFLAMTAPEININKLTFYVDGADAGENQPIVRIVLRGVVGRGAIVTPFLVQTSVSPRIPNFKP